MGLFSRQQKELEFENIISVVILEQTQLYKNKSKWGVSFGSTLGDGHVIAMDGQHSSWVRNQVQRDLQKRQEGNYQSNVRHGGL